MKIAIIGSGSFGCALSHLLIKNNNEVKMWSYTEEEKDLINKKHICKYLDDYKMSPKIKCYTSYEEAIEDTDYIILVSPSNSIREICKDIKEFVKKQHIIIASKGLEDDKMMTEIVKEELNKNASVISGPSHAEQIVKDEPTFVEYSGEKGINELFETSEFKMEYNKDIIGVQLGGALKNIITLAVGIGIGLEFETNTISYIVTEGLEEIRKIGIKLGAKEETFYELSGLGDLITTSFSDDSRNRKAGILLAQGKNLDELGTIEGLNNLKSVKKIIDKYKLDCKLITSLYEVIYKNKEIKNILSF